MADEQQRSKVLAYTVTYGDRRFLKETVPAMRGKADMWFDWAVWTGDPSLDAEGDAISLLHDPNRLGIQYLSPWRQNRGQHHATKEAIALAKKKGYEWLLRIDDDIRPRSRRWLKHMIEWTEDLRRRAKDKKRRIVSAPRIVGLRHPPSPTGTIDKGQKYPANLMEILGGGVRLHPMELLENYEAPIYEPLGRGDPQSIAEHVTSNEGMLVQFPSIRVVHQTKQLEKRDSEEQALRRRMGYLWCYLGPGCEDV